MFTLKMKNHIFSNRASTEHAPLNCPQVPPKPWHIIKNFGILPNSKKRDEIQDYLNLKDRKHFRVSILNLLLNENLLELQIPDKPQSPKQKYTITKKGQDLLDSIDDKKNESKIKECLKFSGSILIIKRPPVNFNLCRVISDWI